MDQTVVKRTSRLDPGASRAMTPTRPPRGGGLWRELQTALQLAKSAPSMN